MSSTDCFEKLCEIWLESYPQVASSQVLPLNQKKTLLLIYQHVPH
jgi:hypothetical protein